MSAIFDFLYQEYCFARLAEMRKQLWLTAQNLETTDVESADPDSVRDDQAIGEHLARTH